MENMMLVRVADALIEDDLQDEGDTQFCVTDELFPTRINIEVEGIGPMIFPINRAYIEKLINISSKAQCGCPELTILDENILNSYEIKSDKLHITINEQSLTCVLSKMCNALGLCETSVLTPHLHNMLIYGPGHFFYVHQDTEKVENVVATLVVVLPSPHIGGDLIIEHGKKKHTFSSGNIDSSNAKCIGFYADCKHKIEKVKQGYRIALTYNLVLKSEEFYKVKNVNLALKNAIADYFNVAIDEKPQKLVYFLNHSYTKHSLRWEMLKGADRTNTSAIYAVAKELDLTFNFALVAIQQSWSTDPRIDYKIVDEISLFYWLDSNNKKLPFDKCCIDKYEICWTKETESFELYSNEDEEICWAKDTESELIREYEGLINKSRRSKMDYWYERAAIVLWPESKQIQINFMLNYDNALNELCVLTSSLGNEKKAMEIIAKAGKHLYRTLNEKEESDFELLANIALYIKDQDTALSILSRFKWGILNYDIVKLLVKLQTQYGISWCINLLKTWERHKCGNLVLNEINTFVQNFLNSGGEASIVNLLLDVQSNALIYKNKDFKRKKPKRKKPVQCTESSTREIAMLYQILTACAAIQNIGVLKKVIQHLITNLEFYQDTSLAELYFKLQDSVPSEYFSNYELLKSYLVKTIDNNLALMRSDDDWSIQAKLSCNCEHCKEVMNFLCSKTEITKIWQIPAAIHVHITNIFKGLDLPVDLSVEGKDSPHKLIMVKNELLHKNAKKRYDELKFYQQRFQSVKRIKLEKSV